MWFDTTTPGVPMFAAQTPDGTQYGPFDEAEAARWREAIGSGPWKVVPWEPGPATPEPVLPDGLVEAIGAVLSEEGVGEMGFGTTRELAEKLAQVAYSFCPSAP